MSNRRHLHTAHDSTVVTPAMVDAWKQDPSAVPAEHRSLWEEHGGATEWTPPHSALEAVRLADVHLAGAAQSLADQVSRARAEGHSWGEIGAVLGVSKQAVQQRFGV